MQQRANPHHSNKKKKGQNLKQSVYFFSTGEIHLHFGMIGKPDQLKYKRDILKGLWLTELKSYAAA